MKSSQICIAFELLEAISNLFKSLSSAAHS
jgi:hypothetical protein